MILDLILRGPVNITSGYTVVHFADIYWLSRFARVQLCSRGMLIPSNGAINRTTSPSPTSRIVLVRFNTSTTTSCKIQARRLGLKFPSVSFPLLNFLRHRTNQIVDGATTTIVASRRYFQPGQQISIPAPHASPVTFSSSTHDRASWGDKRS